MVPQFFFISGTWIAFILFRTVNPLMGLYLLKDKTGTYLSRTAF
ncbi:hypothetical protein LEP1GSC125_3431 [Leptospira mayottensis 200901122]|uniref:Uncharacterized protein n=1 Tax=Leptospira mayottensis 200901122 TaxID=1193010 RepID=A0AA87MQL6_9LEPT|nr:hypothetical protein LEP1GSC125_3431 [Leptospira mayottensis 200901122]